MDTNNPVGKAVDNVYVSKFVESMKALWDSTKEKVSWWKIWRKAKISTATKFLLKCLDDLIAYVDQIVDTSGPDKKATVLLAITQIYDYIIKEAMPVWLKPVASTVRGYIINSLISAAIDWIVEKYRHGDWRQTPAEEIEAQWVQLHFQMFGK
jgi:hypothetical protein